jgi:formylglycine-generating enzyme required for sulfatase activity
MDYLDFDLTITISAGGESAYPVEARSPAGEATATLHWTLSGLALENRLKDLQIALLTSGRGRRAPSREEATVQQFGGELFDALISGEIRSRYDVIQTQARREGKGVRLRLRIDPPLLASLPWEFLYDRRSGEYVCLSRQTPIVRYLDLPQPVGALPVQPPLRILGLIASPSDLPALDVAVERERIERAVRPLQARGLLELTWLEGQSWRDLQRAMTGGPWHIFHFVGHGDYDPTRDEGQIALTGASGKAHFFSARELARLLADHAALRLVLLNACKGAASGQQDRFASTAATLVRRGIPAVIAMQYPITDYAAIEFAQSFYENLAQTMPVDAAVTEARKAISFAIDNTVEWGTPVLYLRAQNGQLFAMDKRPHPSPPQTGEGAVPPSQPAPLERAAAIALPPPEPAPVEQPAAAPTPDVVRAAESTPAAPPASETPRVMETVTPQTAPAQPLIPPAQRAQPASERQAGSAGKLPIAQKSPANARYWRWIVGGLIAIAVLYISVTTFTSWQQSQREAQVMATAEARATALAVQARATMTSRDPALLPLIDQFDMPFVYVPAGTFTMGSPESVGYDDERPAHEVTLDAYWIGQSEVTNAQYRRFVAAGGYTQEPLWTPEGWQWRTTNNITEPEYWDDPKWNGDDYPVVGVSWYEASAFATWLSQESGLTVRLPSEAEWERAARGEDGRTYPWGDEVPNERLLNYAYNLGRTSTVGSYPAGASPYGALDMAGNVWEWVDDWYDVGYYTVSPGQNPQGPESGEVRVVRGGSWLNDDRLVRSADRYGFDPQGRRNNLGFRFAVSPGS